MFNLLLVDDETVILNGLYDNIEWEDAGFSQVFRASDGRQALELLRETRMDVVVSDIMMPGLDGLSMCEELRRLWPYAKIVFLSGYREFEYARRAVDLGAYQYVVKPVRYEDLLEIVKGALDELKTELNERSILEKSRRQTLQMRELLRERYLRDWLLRGDANPVGSPGEAAECGVSVSPDMRGQLMLLRVDSAEGGAADGHESPRVIELAINGLVEKLLAVPGYEPPLSVSVDRQRSLFLFLGSDAVDTDSSRALKSRLEPLQLAISETLSLTVSLFIGETAPPKRLNEYYQALSRASTHMDGMMAGAIIEVPRERPEPDLGRLARSLRQSGDGIPSPDECIDEILRDADAALNAHGDDADGKHCRKIELQSQLYTELFSLLLSEAVRRGMRLDDWYASCRQFWENPGEGCAPCRFESMEAFGQACRQAVAYFVEFSNDQQRSQRRRLIKQIDAIIDSGFGNGAGAGMTVSGIAGALHYTPGYLSQLVKGETGMSLADYVIDKRIARARELLDSGEQVSRVAGMVGYDSFAHFSRIFKKLVGMSPKQYQQYG